MKVLVLSLLRLGDVLMTGPALQSLRRKYPDVKIHLLVNDAAKGVASVLKDVEVHVLPRSVLQEALVAPERQILEPIWRLLRVMQPLQQENFDLVLNFTHNRFSARMASFFPADRVLGMRLDNDGSLTSGSPWFRYLDENAGRRGRWVVHHSDVFRFALDDLQDPDLGFLKSETELSQAGVVDDLARSDALVLQPLSSDAKKDWSFANWTQALKLFHLGNPTVPVTLLGAPFERERLSHLRDLLLSQGVKVQLAVTSLPEALRVLRRARLVVTADTAIKHLAADGHGALLELNLGSADFFRTGAYRDQTWILSSEVPCWPCAHSESCHQSSHLCGDNLDAQSVAEVMSLIWQARFESLRGWTCAKKTPVVLRQASVSAVSQWLSVRSGAYAKRELTEGLDAMVLRSLLASDEHPFARLDGTLAHRLLSGFRLLHPDLDTAAVLEMLDAEADRDEELLREVADAKARFGVIMNEAATQVRVDLVPMRALQSRVGEINFRIEARQRMVRSMRAELREAL